jgi:DNA-binding winged helix-turn-helix (wHTH) protein/Tfp pilus assembly protein PilF
MPSPGTLRFAEFVLDPVNQELRRDGVVIKLPPQPFRILLILVERHGTLVRREELQQAVWGELVVDLERGLNTAIRQVRQALGDDAESPRFIETVPRLGYRFVTPVVSTETATALSPEPLPARRPRWVLAAPTIAAGTLVLVTLGWVLAQDAQARASRAEAREMYLRGRLALEDPTPASARTARELFERALIKDATFAPAYAAMADVYLQKPTSIPNLPPAEATSRASAAVEQALALDGTVPEVHLSAAKLHMTLRDWPAAGRDYRRAIELAPNHSLARQQYSLWLSYQERFDEALAEARLAEALDSLSLAARTNLAEVYRQARHFDEAFTQAQRILELNPNFGRAYAVLGQCHLAQGRPDLAIEEFRRANTLGQLGYAYAAAGQLKEARETLQRLESRYAANRIGPGEIAQVYIGLHEFDRAFEWLARAVDDGAIWTLRVAVVFDPIRSDPRFAQLLRRTGYAE